MKKLLKNIIPAILVGLIVSAAVQAQVAPPQFFKKVGNNVYPLNPASTTIGTSTVNGAFYNLNVSGTCTGCSGGGGSSTTIQYLVAASNAPTSTKAIANYLATGSNDDVIINQALAAASSSGGGTVTLSIGTFNTSGTIKWNSQGVGLSCGGMYATSIIGNNATSVIHIGNRQAGGALNAYESLSNCSVFNTNGSSTQTVWVDGMGHNGRLQNLNIQNQNGGKYALTLEDIDRDSMDNVYVQGGIIAPLFSEEGLENTWSNLAASNIIVVPETPSNTSSTDWLWDADSDQASPSPFERVTITNAHFFAPTSGLTGSTGMKFNVGTRTFTTMGSLWENPDIGVMLNAEVHADFISNSFLDDNVSSTDLFQFNNDANSVLTIDSNNFQQATNIFHSVGSTFPTLSFEGVNKNDGNIANVINGSVSYLSGTDFNFLPDNNLQLGFDGTGYKKIVTNILHSSSTQLTNIGNNEVLTTDGSGTGNVVGSSSLTYNGTTLTLTNASGTQSIVINQTGNAGTGASTGGAIHVNCSQNSGFCEEVYAASVTPGVLLRVDNESPDNTTLNGAQTITTTSTCITVAAAGAAWGSSGTLLLEDSTSTSENSNTAFVHFTTSTATTFCGTAGTFFKDTTQFVARDGSKVFLSSTNDHNAKIHEVNYATNGAAVDFRLVAPNPDIEFDAFGGYNNSIGQGQFEIDVPTGDNVNQTSTDVGRLNGRTDDNSQFQPVFLWTRPGLAMQGKSCIGFQNLITPVQCAAHLHIKNDSFEGDTNSGALPVLILQGSDLGQTADYLDVKNNTGTILASVDANGNVSTTGHFYDNGTKLLTSVTVTTSTPTTTPAVDTTSTLVTVTSTLATSTAYSFTIPANKLGTAGAMYDIRQSGTFVQNSGGTVAPYILYLGLNGVLVASDTPQTLAGASSPTGTWYGEYTITNFGGSTNTQIVSINTFGQRGGSQLTPRTNTALGSVDSTQPITVSLWISSASTTATESVTSGQVAVQFIGAASPSVTSVTGN